MPALPGQPQRHRRRLHGAPAAGDELVAYLLEYRRVAKAGAECLQLALGVLGAELQPADLHLRRVGAKILADEPDYLRAQIDLGYAGYLAASNKDESHNAEAIGYARKAIQAIEGGKSPTEWAPFKGKDDTLAYLNYAIGFMTLKSSPEQAIDSLIKATQYQSDIKKTPSTYYFLAVAYESGPYKTLSTAYQTNFANKPETAESKAALEKLNVLMDRIIDAYARAIATAGSDPKTEQSRKEWLAQLTNYYKFRNNGSDAGLTEFIAASLQKPLPPKPQL